MTASAPLQAIPSSIAAATVTPQPSAAGDESPSSAKGSIHPTIIAASLPNNAKQQGLPAKIHTKQHQHQHQQQDLSGSGAYSGIPLPIQVQMQMAGKNAFRTNNNSSTAATTNIKGGSNNNNNNNGGGNTMHMYGGSSLHHSTTQQQQQQYLMAQVQPSIYDPQLAAAAAAAAAAAHKHQHPYHQQFFGGYQSPQQYTGNNGGVANNAAMHHPLQQHQHHHHHQQHQQQHRMASGSQQVHHHSQAADPMHPSSVNTNDRDASKIGWHFVREYYNFLSKESRKLHCFYESKSVMVHGTEGEEVRPAIGQSEIHRRIAEMDYSDCKVLITTVDSQPSAAGSIAITVIGEMSVRRGATRKFVQTFVLAEQSHGYYVLNDTLRFLRDESDVAELQAEAAATAAATNSASFTRGIIDRHGHIIAPRSEGKADINKRDATSTITTNRVSTPSAAASPVTAAAAPWGIAGNVAGSVWGDVNASINDGWGKKTEQVTKKAGDQASRSFSSTAANNNSTNNTSAMQTPGIATDLGKPAAMAATPVLDPNNSNNTSGSFAARVNTRTKDAGSAATTTPNAAFASNDRFRGGNSESSGARRNSKVSSDRGNKETLAKEPRRPKRDVNFKSSIFIRGYSNETKAAELEEKCAEFGTVKHFDFIPNKFMAFCEFTAVEAAQKAIAGTLIVRERKLSVEERRPPPALSDIQQQRGNDVSSSSRRGTSARGGSGAASRRTNAVSNEIAKRTSKFGSANAKEDQNTSAAEKTEKDTTANKNESGKVSVPKESKTTIRLGEERESVSKAVKDDIKET